MVTEESIRKGLRVRLIREDREGEVLDTYEEFDGLRAWVYLDPQDGDELYCECSCTECCWDRPRRSRWVPLDQIEAV